MHIWIERDDPKSKSLIIIISCSVPVQSVTYIHIDRCCTSGGISAKHQTRAQNLSATKFFDEKRKMRRMNATPLFKLASSAAYTKRINFRIWLFRSVAAVPSKRVCLLFQRIANVIISFTSFHQHWPINILIYSWDHRHNINTQPAAALAEKKRCPNRNGMTNFMRFLVKQKLRICISSEIFTSSRPFSTANLRFIIIIHKDFFQ